MFHKHSVIMDGENWPRLIDEPVKFKNQLVQVQDFRIITNHFEDIIEYTPYW